jgi:hypothetical protein
MEKSRSYYLIKRLQEKLLYHTTSDPEDIISSNTLKTYKSLHPDSSWVKGRGASNYRLILKDSVLHNKKSEPFADRNRGKTSGAPFEFETRVHGDIKNLHKHLVGIEYSHTPMEYEKGKFIEKPKADAERETSKRFGGVPVHIIKPGREEKMDKSRYTFLKRLENPSYDPNAYTKKKDSGFVSKLSKAFEPTSGFARIQKLADRKSTSRASKVFSLFKGKSK